MKKILYILIAVGLFSSCEYDPSGNNFIELTPPDDFIAIDISLNDVDPADTIYVFENTRISIRINAEKKLKQAVVLLDGKEYYYLNNSSDFILRRNELKEGVHKLTVNAVFSSGTGSLAEMMGMEGYMGELSWNIRVMPDPATHFKVDYRLNEEGFLEIYWKNIIPEDAIKEYVVRPPYITQENIHIIDNPVQKSFVDYGYVCGQISYEVRTNLKSGYSYSQIISLNKPEPNIYFEDLGVDKLRIYWDKPFANGRFTLSESGTTIASAMNDTTITISQTFGPNRHFGLETRPQKPEYDSSRNRFYVWNWFRQGINLGLYGGQFYAYSTTDNIIYASSTLTAFDATTLNIKTQNMHIASDRVACAPHNSTVAAMTSKETLIFADSRFTNQIIIPNLSGNINTRLSALTSDDRFFVVPGNPGQLETSGYCHVFNVKTGEKIFDFSFTHAIVSIALPNCVTISDDGRYFFAASVNGMELFEISGTTTNLLYADARRYTSATFVPNQPDKLLVRADSDIELRQMPNFKLIQKLDVSPTGAILCNVDPKTGNLLYYQDGFLKIAPVNDLANPIFEIRSDETRCKLFNNKLVTGILAFDINPYINP